MLALPLTNPHPFPCYPPPLCITTSKSLTHTLSHFTCLSIPPVSHSPALTQIPNTLSNLPACIV